MDVIEIVLFVTIPNFKGKLKSRESRLIIDECKSLIDNNIKELVLVAQDLTAYGNDSIELKIEDLISRISNIEGDFWIRLLYIYPDSVSERLLDMISNNPKICSYLDIPIQHTSEKILNSMNRKNSRKKIHELISLIKNKYSNIHLRTTIMLGFPNETDEDFEILVNDIKDFRFTYLGTFIYSDEEDCKAFNLENKVRKKIANQRKNNIDESTEKNYIGNFRKL